MSAIPENPFGKKSLPQNENAFLKLAGRKNAVNYLAHALVLQTFVHFMCEDSDRYMYPDRMFHQVMERLGTMSEQDGEYGEKAQEVMAKIRHCWALLASELGVGEQPALAEEIYRSVDSAHASRQAGPEIRGVVESAQWVHTHCSEHYNLFRQDAEAMTVMGDREFANYLWPVAGAGEDVRERAALRVQALVDYLAVQMRLHAEFPPAGENAGEDFSLEHFIGEDHAALCAISRAEGAVLSEQRTPELIRIREGFGRVLKEAQKVANSEVEPTDNYCCQLAAARKRMTARGQESPAEVTDLLTLHTARSAIQHVN